MDKFKQLEQKKIFKEFEYIKTDYEFKNEIISEVDSEFINNVNEFLKERPDLKEKFEKKMGKRFDDANNNGDSEEKKEDVDNSEDGEKINPDQIEDNLDDEGNISEEVEVEPKKEKSPKVKKIYREIVKLTHPDKVKVKKLNDLYLKATDYYDSNDIVGLYSICNELGIEYELDESDNESILLKIKSLKGKIGFIESTFTWKWYSAKDKEKENLILNYIQLQLNS
tara:strand:- start:623 stop:1297 length:675 start_codon:yes stop_codon:yes gene_type:complete